MTVLWREQLYDRLDHRSRLCTNRVDSVTGMVERQAVLAEIVRSGFVEGHHYGSVVALAADGSRRLVGRAT